MAYDSVTSWRLYAAEQSIGLGTPLPDIETAHAFLDRIRRSAWWRWNIRSGVRIELELGGREGGGLVNSYSQPIPGGWKVSIHPEQLNDLILLHELAHCAAPDWIYGGPTEPGALPRHRRWHFHGAAFAGFLAELVGEFGTGAAHDDLRDAFAHFEVPALTLEELREAIADDDRVRDDLDQLEREHPSAVATVMGFLRADPRTPLLGKRWGDTLLMARHRAVTPAGRKPSQEWVAEQVTQVVKCTRRDVSRIENLEDAPEDEKTYQQALTMAILFDLDPVFVEHQMGLDRAEWDPPSADLATLNSSWVDLVATMTAQVRARPAVWAVRGDR